jgi:hypothetical protein
LYWTHADAVFIKKKNTLVKQFVCEIQGQDDEFDCSLNEEMHNRIYIRIAPGVFYVLKMIFHNLCLIITYRILVRFLERFSG